MPIVASDIEFRFSGGATNTDPNACLGGAISTAGAGLVDNAIKNDLFDDVSAVEEAAGDIEYRGIYIKNIHGTITLVEARIFHSADDANAGDVIDMALADEAVTTTIETIANEGTAPVGPTFTHPTTYAGGLALNSTTGLVAAAYKGVWLRRTITAGAAAGSISNTIKVEGTTV